MSRIIDRIDKILLKIILIGKLKSMVGF